MRLTRFEGADPLVEIPAASMSANGGAHEYCIREVDLTEPGAPLLAWMWMEEGFHGGKGFGPGEPRGPARS